MNHYFIVSILVCAPRRSLPSLAPYFDERWKMRVFAKKLLNLEGSDPLSLILNASLSEVATLFCDSFSFKLFRFSPFSISIFSRSWAISPTKFCRSLQNECKSIHGDVMLNVRLHKLTYGYIHDEM